MLAAAPEILNPFLSRDLQVGIHLRPASSPTPCEKKNQF
jgi:hypothetical protein